MKKSHKIIVYPVWALCLLFSQLMAAETPIESNTVNAKSWTPARAEAVQSRTADRQLKKLKTKADNRGRAEARKQLLSRRSGFGAIPHAQLDRDEQAILQEARRLSEIQRDAISQTTGPSVSSAGSLDKMMPVIQAAGVDMILKTPALGAVTGSGWAYAYHPDTQEYLGRSLIGGDGSVSLPVSAGEIIDVIAFVSPPFAFQVARRITATAGGDLMLVDAVEIDVSITDPEGSLLPGVSTNLNLVLKSYLSFGWSGGNVSGTGKIYLAPGELYELKSQPEIPYLASGTMLVDSTSPPLLIKLEEGLQLTIDFDDPDGLVGKDGCTSSGNMDVYSSQDVLESWGRPLSVPQAQKDASNNLVGFITAVPAGVAFDYVIRFDTGTNRCMLEDFSSRFLSFSKEQTFEEVLKPRPNPNVIFQTPAGDPLVYDYGYFYGEGPFAQSVYFSPTSKPSLVAGETYWANVRVTGDFKVNETMLVAQAGDFDVVLESEPLITVKSSIKIAIETNVTALLELYRDGELVEAFEYQSREVTMEIPAGVYDVRVSGITAYYWESPVSYSVFLKPFELTRTFTGVGEERMDFVLDLPESGVHYSLPNTEIPYQFFVYEGATLRAAQVVYPWYGGIRTDFSQFDLVIRGPGFDDASIAVNPGIAFPTLDIASVQGPVGRLQGTVVNQLGDPVEGVNIDLYAEDGLFGWDVHQTGPTGAFDIPKVMSGLFAFNAPDAGNSIMTFIPVSNAGSVGNMQVKLRDLNFHTVSEGGPTRQLLYGTGSRGYQLAFLSEAYVAQKESITDTNQNNVWDGVLFLDLNDNGLWEQGEPYQNYGERVLDHNSENGTDITAGNEPFVDLNGDGYPNIDDFAVFVQNAKNYVRSLLGTPEIKDNIEFDAYIIFLPSAQAGTDVIDDTGEEDVKLIDLDTRFAGAYLLKRSLLSIDYGKANESLDLHAPERDLTIVLLNQPVRAGRANSFILAYGGVGNSPPNSLVAGHEFGHNPGSLADEYNEFSGTSTRYFSPSLKHLTHRTVTSDIPWFEYINPRGDLPISVPQSPGNGVYAGGNYEAGGAYRSTETSRMRSNAPLFNDVSLDVFRHSLCVRSLTDEDFRGAPTSSPEEGVIFTDSFESRNGVLLLCE